MNITKASKSFLATINNDSIEIDRTKLITIFCTSLLCALFCIAAAAPVQAESTMARLMEVIGNEREETKPNEREINGGDDIGSVGAVKPVTATSAELPGATAETKNIKNPDNSTGNLLEESASPKKSASIPAVVAPQNAGIPSDTKPQESNEKDFMEIIEKFLEILMKSMSQEDC